MKGNFHVQCGVRENLEIISKSYLSLWYKIAKKKKLTGAKRVAYVAGYVAVNSINPFKAIKKVSRAVKSVKRLRKVTKTYKRAKKSKVFLKKAKKVVKATYKKSKRSVKKSSKKVYKGYLKAKCKITKKGCFVEGTLILTENGLVPIEDIEIGDYVWAENPKTGEIELKEVLDTFEKQVDTIVTITVDGETIETTEAHVFYVENVGWLPASMLKQGDILHLEDGRTVPIESIETITYNYYVNVYNFEVEDFHTYYVSDLSVLVHNSCKRVQKKGCFTEDTLILTEDGLIKIDEIEVGDFVWSENPETGDITLKEVKETFVNKTDTLVYIIVNGETIKTTEGHVFYVENVGWLPASMLKQGDILSLEDGGKLPIQSIKTVEYNHYISVYNFEVEDYHTYYVSDESILVHNTCMKNPQNGIYEKASYHGVKNNGRKNKAPNNGQEALDNSIPISENTTRRIGISDGEFVVLDETTKGVFHGHVRSWNELSEKMKAVLIKAGKVNKKGKIK